MKKLLLLCAMVLGLAGDAYMQEQALTLNEFKGLVDVVPADKLALGYSPDLLNVDLTRYEGTVSKRYGYQTALNTPLQGSQKIRNVYNYTKINGNKYIIMASSWSIFYTSLDGANSVLRTFNSSASTWTWNFATGKDNLYGFSASTTPFYWTGSAFTWITPSISTGMVSGNYVCYHNNRLWIAGVSGEESTVYYSQANDPLNIGTFNYIYVNVSDGQKITGFLSSNNKLYVFKEFSVYEVVEVSAGSFILRQVSKDVGALYQDGITEHRGMPTFLSHRGIEMYSGELNLLSEPIDNTIRSLSQLKTGQGQVSWTTASDFGGGTFVNVDSTTASGDVVLAPKISVPISFATPDTLHYRYRQKFVPQEDIANPIVSVGLYGNFETPYEVAITSADMSVMVSSQTSVISDVVPFYYGVTIKFPTSYILKNNSTYYILISSINAQNINILPQPADPYPNGSLQYSDNWGTTWLDYGTGYDLPFKIGLSTGIYISPVRNAAGWTQWGVFNGVDMTAGKGQTIDYYVRVATASDIITSKPYLPISNGVSLSTTTGPYIQFIASFSATSLRSTVVLDYVSQAWGGVSAVPIVLKSFKDNLWVAISTDTNTNINNVAMIFDRKNNWIPYNHEYIGGACVVNNNLYTGSSNDAGMLYLQDVPGLYTDSIGAYDSYWTSGILDLQLPFTEKTFNSAWVTTKNDGNMNLACDYRLDGYEGSYSSINVPVYDAYSGIARQKINYPQATKGYAIQLRFGNNNANEYYQLRRFDLFYEVEQPR